MFNKINKKENQNPPPIMTNGKIGIILLIAKYSTQPNTPNALVSLSFTEKKRLFFCAITLSLGRVLIDDVEGGGVD